MKIFFVSIGDELRASSRFRVYNTLRHNEWQFDSYHYAVLVSGRCGLRGKIARQFRYIYSFFLCLFCTYDTLVLQEVVYPKIAVAFLLNVRDIKLIFDFSDPLDQHLSSSKSFMSSILLKGFEFQVKNADYVFVENSLYQDLYDEANIIVSRGPVKVVEREYYDKGVSSDDIIRIAWTGSEGTLHYVKEYIPVLDDLASTLNIELNLIGTDKEFEVDNLSIKTYKWDLDIEKEILTKCHYGLFALPKEDALKYRGGGKLFVYINYGLEILSNDFGIASQLSNDGVKLNFISFDAASIRSVFTSASANNVSHNFEVLRKLYSQEAYIKSLSHCVLN